MEHMRAGREPPMGTPEKPEEIQFYTELLIQMYRDTAAICNLGSSSRRRDIKTLRRRARTEGMSFLTRTLPSLGKNLDKALSSDCQFPISSCFARSKKTNLPVLFGGFWRLIFNSCGYVADDSQVDVSLQVKAVRSVRQLTKLFYKLEGSHTPDSEAEVLQNFVSVDSSLPEEGEMYPLTLKTKQALENARMVIWYVLKGLNPLHILPRHGPGAVATGEKQWKKMHFQRFYERLDQVYSYPEYFFFNHSHLCDELESLEAMTSCSIATAKVVMVPKDSRGPRLISMEPLELQWIQQGLMRMLVQRIQHPDSASCGFVNFTNQMVNRDLALESSCHGDFVTVDLQEASDRVSVWLVDHLFPSDMFNSLMSCRSQETELPDGHRLTLKKFAPMGSSVCFPVEALIFWALAVGSLRDVYRKSHLYDLPEVYVYGDDIIFRKEYYDTIKDVFEELHLKFNEDKCCVGRFFRESCGMDAFKCHAVVPLYVKAPFLDKPSHVAVLSYIAYSNSCRERGYARSADFLQASIASKSGSIPTIISSHALPYAFVDSSLDVTECCNNLLLAYKSRENSRLQRLEIRVPTVSAHTIRYGEPDWSEVLRVLPQMGPPDPFGFDDKNLEPCHYAVPHQIKMRWKWVGLLDLLMKTDSPQDKAVQSAKSS